MKTDRKLKKLLNDPDRWVDADMQRKFWLYKAVRILATSAILSCTVIAFGIYVRARG